MRIAEFWARGFRCLRDVGPLHLGPVAVFYGPNGSGKSSVFAAIETLLRLAAIRGRSFPLTDVNSGLGYHPDSSRWTPRC